MPLQNEPMPWEDNTPTGTELMPWEEEPSQESNVVQNQAPEDIQTSFDNMFKNEGKIFQEEYNQRHPNEPMKEPATVPEEKRALPRPVSNMYDGMTDEEAQRVYEIYKNDPNTEGGLDGIFYRDIDGVSYKVPYPTKNIGLKGIGAGELASGAVRNAGKNILKTATSVRDVLTGQDTVGSLDESIGEMDWGGGRDSFIGEGAQILIGMGGALKAASTIPQLMKNSPKLAKAAQALMAEIGMASTMDEDVDTLVIGENAWIPLLRGINLDDEREASNQLEKRLNILADGLVAAKVLEKGIQATTWTTKLAKGMILDPVMGFFSKDKQAKTLVGEMIQNVLQIENATDPELKQKLMNNLIEKIRNNKEVIVKIDNIEGLDQIEINRDTMGAIIEGYKGDPVTTARAAEMRKGQGKASTMKKMAEPSSKFRELLDTIEDTSGGTKSINEAGDILRKSGEKDVQLYKNAITKIEDDIKLTKEDVTSLIKNDPSFGEKLKKLAETSGDFTVHDLSRMSEDEIADAFNKGIKAMRTQRKALYDAIPDNAFADEESLADFITKIGADEDTISSLPKNVRRLFGEDADLSNFKYLHNEVLPQVSKEINRLEKANIPNRKAYETLIELKDNILSQVDYLAESGQDAAYNAVQTARQWETEVYAPLLRQGPMQDVANTAKTTVERGIKDVEYSQTVQDTLTKSLREQKRHEAKQIIDVLSRPEFGNRPDLITDYILGNTISELHTKIISGEIADLSSEEAVKFVTSLSDFSNIIKDSSPAQAERIGAFVASLRNSKDKLRTLEEMLPAAKEAMEQAENVVLDGELKNFFKKQGDLRIPVESGMESFSSIFRQGGNTALVKQLVNRAKQEGNELALKGMQAAYARHVREALTTAGTEVGGAANINLTQGKKIRGEVTDLLNYGDILFKDKPGVMDATRQILNIATDNEISKRVPSMSATTQGSEEKKFRSVFDMINTLVFGPLNRVGSRVRSTGSRVIANMSPEQETAIMLEQLYSDPDYFLSVAEKIAKEGTSNISPATKEMIWKLGLRTGIYRTEDKEEYKREIDTLIGADNISEQMRTLRLTNEFRKQ